MLLLLSVHPSRTADLVRQDGPRQSPRVPVTHHRDSFGNVCTRLVAPAGRITLFSDAVLRDSGLPDPVSLEAVEHPVQELPDEALTFLLGSRYCETDVLSDTAWQLFGQVTPGWSRVQAICDYVHRHIAFDYQHASATRTAAQALEEGRGVCRDYAHLAVAFCRCLNIPARYCTGYLGDMGTPQPWGVPDLAAWFEVYLSGAWHTFDARNNVPRIGRILLARGRDATDVAISTSFGAARLEQFTVWTDEVSNPNEPHAAVRPGTSSDGTPETNTGKMFPN